MSRITFLFLCGIFTTFTVLSGGEVNAYWEVVVCMTLIALVGIPHGSIDHVLMMEAKKTKAKYFYSFYLGLMALYIFLWVVWPATSLILFLLISAFHFGQSQFSSWRQAPALARNVVSFTWGTFILSALIFFHRTELTVLFGKAEDLKQLTWIVDNAANELVAYTSGLATFAGLLWLAWRGYINTEIFFGEVYTLALILLCFYVLPVLTGFTLYFVILHSVKVMVDEFSFLKKRRRAFSLKTFLYQLLPYTLLSIGGAAMLIGLSSTPWLGLSSLMVVLILASAFTLPHSIIMDRFYNQVQGKQH